MAESPRKSKTSQVFDVSKPNRSRPSHTAKPVIVTNRPILHDPMVNSSETADEGQTAAPLAVKLPTKINIQPLDSSAELTDTGKSIEVKNMVEDSPGTTEPDITSPISDHLEKARAEAGTTIASGTPDLPVDVDAIALSDVKSTEHESEKITVALTPAARTEPSSGKTVLSQSGLGATESTEPQPQATAKDEMPLKSGTAPLNDQPKDGAQVTDKDLADQEDQEEKNDGKIQEMVIEKRYFLPINTQENRRTKRFIVLGFVLILLLAAAWVDIALDAGLIQIDGLKPLTHLFSN